VILFLIRLVSNYIPNHTLENVLYANFNEVGVPQFDERPMKNLPEKLKAPYQIQI